MSFFVKKKRGGKLGFAFCVVVIPLWIFLFVPQPVVLFVVSSQGKKQELLPKEK